MKLIVMTAFVFLFLAQVAGALPHLTCDQYVPGSGLVPTSFILKFDFATHPDITIPPRVDAQGRADIWYEITIPDGVYTVRALACIETNKCSEPSNPATFTKAIPVLPLLKIVQQGTSVYLTSDPYVPGSGVGIPDDFLIKRDGAQGAVTSIAKIDPTGKIILWYDVTNLTSGTHTFQVSARNMWGASPETAIFSYVKESPAKPAIKLQK